MTFLSATSSSELSVISPPSDIPCDEKNSMSALILFTSSSAKCPAKQSLFVISVLPVQSTLTRLSFSSSQTRRLFVITVKP